MMQKILVSGAGGFVGARVMHLWRGQAELTIFPRGFLAAATEEEVIRFAAQVQPDVILHLAALSDTGYCQRHPEESRRANVELPCWMAKAARAAGAKLVAFSPIRSMPESHRTGRWRKRFRSPRPTSTGSTSWKPSSGHWNFCPMPFCCGCRGCTIFREMTCPSGAICR